jgi:hypothetical protein
MEVSRHYTTHPDNTDRLIHAALPLDSVLFLTLNYDTILDSRLALQTGPIMSMDDYVREDHKSALVKLHGSVDWARSVDVAEIRTIDSRLTIAFDELGEELEQRLDPEIHLRGIADIQNFRYDRTIPRLYFPALSVPLGSEDELLCPPNHVDFVRQRLKSSDGLNLLVIGYSGLDQEVLRLLRESKNSLRSLLVINQDTQGADQAHGRIMDEFPDASPPGPGASNASFNTWAQSSELDAYFDDLQ